MASRSLFFPFLRTRKESQARIAYRAPSMQTILVVFAVLLILLLWMHFILAMEIESMGRQNQIDTERLNKIKRENAALQIQGAEIASQENLSRRALEMGYGLHTPIYLRLAEPLSDSTGKGPSLPTNGSSGETPTQGSLPLSTGARTLAASSETDTVP
jgi:cell division protein FtsB